MSARDWFFRKAAFKAAYRARRESDVVRKTDLGWRYPQRSPDMGTIGKRDFMSRMDELKHDMQTGHCDKEAAFRRLKKLHDHHTFDHNLKDARGRPVSPEQQFQRALEAHPAYKEAEAIRRAMPESTYAQKEAVARKYAEDRGVTDNDREPDAGDPNEAAEGEHEVHSGAVQARYAKREMDQRRIQNAAHQRLMNVAKQLKPKFPGRTIEQIYSALATEGPPLARELFNIASGP